MVNQRHNESAVWEFLSEVPDPEIPVISVVDLGVVRKVRLGPDGEVEITLTPTYVGCPAMSEISMGIRLKLMEKGFRNIHISQQLSPAWNTDLISAEGREKMRAYGIAPPQFDVVMDPNFAMNSGITCPQCGSNDTRLVSEFGSTACKALCQCNRCLEPFDYFKCHV